MVRAARRIRVNIASRASDLTRNRIGLRDTAGQPVEETRPTAWPGSTDNLNRLACGRTMGSRSSREKASRVQHEFTTVLSPGGNAAARACAFVQGGRVNAASGPIAPPSLDVPSAGLLANRRRFSRERAMSRRPRSRRSSRSFRWGGRRRATCTPSGTSVRRSVAKRARCQSSRDEAARGVERGLEIVRAQVWRSSRRARARRALRSFPA